MFSKVREDLVESYSFLLFSLKPDSDTFSNPSSQILLASAY